MNYRLSVKPNPTFELLVSVPVAGRVDNEDVVFTVKSVPESKLNEMTGEGVLYADFAKEIVVGWDLEDKFSKENLMIYLDYRPRAALLLYQAYGAEFYKAAEKN